MLQRNDKDGFQFKYISLFVTLCICLAQYRRGIWNGKMDKLNSCFYTSTSNYKTIYNSGNPFYHIGIYTGFRGGALPNGKTISLCNSRLCRNVVVECFPTTSVCNAVFKEICPRGNYWIDCQFAINNIDFAKDENLLFSHNGRDTIFDDIGRSHGGCPCNSILEIRKNHII